MSSLTSASLPQREISNSLCLSQETMGIERRALLREILKRTYDLDDPYEVGNVARSSDREAQKGAEELRGVIQRLSRWPLVDVESTFRLMDYYASGGSLSIADRAGVIEEFESRFNTVLGLNRAYALSQSSGTVALWNAYQAAGLLDGAQVIVPAYTFHATVSPLVGLGAIPILVDADPRDGNVRLEHIMDAKRANPDCRAVVVTHMWGQPVPDIHEILDFTRRNNMILIEDCSHAHGATIRGASVGSFGDLAVFSCQNNKLVPVGEGGVVLTDSPLLYRRLLSRTHYRRRETSFRNSTSSNELDQFVEEGTGGIKGRIHPLAAVEGCSQLERFRERNAMRSSYACRLRAVLSPCPYIEFQPDVAGVERAWYAMRAKYLPEKNYGRDVGDVIAHAKESGLELHRGTSAPLSELSLFQKAPPKPFPANENRPLYSPGDFPGADEFCANTLVFPVLIGNPTIVDSVCAQIGEIFEK